MQSLHGRRKSGLPTQVGCLGVDSLTQVTQHRGSPLPQPQRGSG